MDQALVNWLLAGFGGLIERDGRILFGIKRLWWLARYGYWRNPYEVEARVVANKHK